MKETQGHIRLPQIGRILDNPEIIALFPRISRPLAAKTVAATVAEIRAAIVAGAPSPSGETILRDCIERCKALAARRIRPVLNATGILLHTNLGRSPLGAEAWERARVANTGYSNLEFDLEAGTRGGRGGLASELAALLAGAESALVVNNNAAAVLLALGSLAAGREVIISRGELVQIGGGFRIPEILELSGAKLVEVGTTNITTTDDYKKAVGPETACVLVVHSSNFAIRGFADKPDIAEIVQALPSELPVIVDQGSGCTSERIDGEVPVSRHMESGASLVSFSGDKLLGGPQSGIIAGHRDLVASCARNPLMRAFRPGKTVLSLLEERLVEALSGISAVAIPRTPEELVAFGDSILSRMPPMIGARLVPSVAAWGGGTSPDEGFPSIAIEIPASYPVTLFLKMLRRGETPIVAAARDGMARLDLAALYGEDPGRIAELIAAAADSIPEDARRKT